MREIKDREKRKINCFIFKRRGLIKFNLINSY